MAGIVGKPGTPGLLVAGRYRLDVSIGQGGMGRVWRASDEVLDRRVAVKEMRMDDPDAEDSRIRRERTLREARATARIDHPNVVRVYDVAEQGDRLWIVMELVDSRSLEQFLTEEGTVSPREAARIGLGLAAALREVHAVGVLHRDIKPGNVLLGRAGRVVLTDFGIAAIQDTTSLTMAGMLVGSPDYMAPERVGGRPQGPPSDIWSLGATLCAAVGGQSPFSRPTTMATLHAVLYEEPVIPSAAGPLASILASLLVKEPSQRPTLDELHARLHLIAHTPPPPPGPPAPPGPAAREEALPDEGRTPPGALEPGQAPPGSNAPGSTPPSAAPSGPAQPGPAPSHAGPPYAGPGRVPRWSEPDPAGAAPQAPAASAEVDAGSGTAPAPARAPGAGGGVAPVPPPESGRTPPHSGPSAEGSGSTGWSAEAHGDESRSAPDTGRPPPAGPRGTARSTPQGEQSGGAPDTGRGSGAEAAAHRASGPAETAPRPPEPRGAPSAAGSPGAAYAGAGPAAGSPGSAAPGAGQAAGPRAIEPPSSAGPAAGSPGGAVPVEPADRVPGAGERAEPHPAARHLTPATPAAPGGNASTAGPAAEVPGGPTATPRRPARPDPRIRSAAASPAPPQAPPPRTPEPSGPHGTAAGLAPPGLAPPGPAHPEPVTSEPTSPRPEAPTVPTASTAPTALSASTAPGASTAPAASGAPHSPTLESPHHAFGPPPGTANASGSPAPAQEAPSRAPEHEQGNGPSRAAEPEALGQQPAPDTDPDVTPAPDTVPTRTPTPASAGPGAPRNRKNRILVAAVLTATAAVAAVMIATAGDPGGGDDGKKGPRSSPTVAGTSRPPSNNGTTGPAATPPSGSRNETGFAWAPPKGWTRSAKSPSNVHYHSPDGQQEIAASYALARGGDLLAQWQQAEQGSQDVPGYRKERLERTTFKGRSAIVWEYFFTDDGRPWRARQLGFNAGGKSYQVNIWYEADTRTEALRTYDRVTDSFTPL